MTTSISTILVLFLIISTVKIASKDLEKEEKYLKVEEGEYVNPQSNIKPQEFLNTTIANYNIAVADETTKNTPTENPKPSYSTLRTDPIEDVITESEVPMEVIHTEPKRRKKAKKMQREEDFDKFIGPDGMETYDAPSCDDFSKFARFNPYTVANAKWISFYYWTPENVLFTVEFFVPTQREIRKLQEVLNNQTSKPINWDAKLLVMKDLLYNTTALLVEQNDRGHYYLYPYLRVQAHKLDPVDVRFKQTSDAKYLAMFFCLSEKVYILARRKDIPPLTKIPDAVASLGYWSRGGRSYLYQGHEWMPIPEMDEVEYWTPSHLAPDDLHEGKEDLGMDNLDLFREPDPDFFN